MHWVYRGPLPVITASVKRPAGKNKHCPEASGIYWHPLNKTWEDRSCACSYAFPGFLWAVWVGASWDGAPVLGH